MAITMHSEESWLSINEQRNWGDERYKVAIELSMLAISMYSVKVTAVQVAAIH